MKLKTQDEYTKGEQTLNKQMKQINKIKKLKTK